MTFLDFEKPLEALYQQLDKVMQIGEQGDVDIAPMREELERKIKDKIKDGLSFGVQEYGKGSIIYLADNPIFRCFWENGKMIFSNAVFLVGQ